MDTNDIGLPISALVTSASLHDSQAAIPLIKLTSRKVTHLYDLMDAAYDAKRIEQTSREFPGRKPGTSTMVGRGMLKASQVRIITGCLISGIHIKTACHHVRLIGNHPDRFAIRPKPVSRFLAK